MKSLSRKSKTCEKCPRTCEKCTRTCEKYPRTCEKYPRTFENFRELIGFFVQLLVSSTYFIMQWVYKPEMLLEALAMSIKAFIIAREF